MWRFSCTDCNSISLYFSNRKKIVTCRKCGNISNQVMDKNINKKVAEIVGY